MRREYNVVATDVEKALSGGNAT